MPRYRWAIRLALLYPLIACSQACDDAKTPTESGGGVSSPAPPAVVRLAWTQAAPSAAAVQSYSFVLFIDGQRTSFAGATCSAASGQTDFQCSGPLPTLVSGRRVLEVAAIAGGLESTRSSPLTVDVGGDGRPRLLTGDEAFSLSATGATTAVSVPQTVCADGARADCFSVAIVARDIPHVRRLIPLPDGRLLLLHEGSAMTVLPSGTFEQLVFGVGGQTGVDVTDVAVDPDFAVNQFLYFATARTSERRRMVSVVRVRELADRAGEPATIIADLPSAAGNPAIAVGPDRHLYLAIPGSAREGTGYEGQILRFTREGQAAGGGIGSPILSPGAAHPSRLAWMGASRLVISSSATGSEPALAIVPVGPDRVQGSPASIAPDADVLAVPPNLRLRDLAVAAPAGTDPTVATVSTTEGDVGRLVILTVSAAGRTQTVREIPLGPVTPTSVAIAANGDLFVAVVGRREPGSLLRLRRISR